MKLAPLLEVAPLSKARATRWEGQRPYVATGDVDDVGNLAHSLVEFNSKPSRADLLAAPGDVVFARMASTSKVFEVTVESSRYVYSTGFAVVRPLEGVLDSTYLKHWLRTRDFQSAKDAHSAGATQRAITNGGLAKMTVPLPSLVAQRRIAAILDHADLLRTRRRQVLTHLDALDQSIFHSLFGVGAEWPLMPLALLGTVTTGKTPPTRSEGMFDGAIPFVTPGDLNSGMAAVRTVTEAGAAASRVVRAGATMVCCIGATIGKTDKAHARSAFNQQINAIEWGENVRDEYGLAAMRNLKPTIIARGASTTLPLLPKGQFTKLVIPVPPVHLQEEFEVKIGSVSDQRVKVELAVNAADELFASLECRAFRGDL